MTVHVLPVGTARPPFSLDEALDALGRALESDDGRPTLARAQRLENAAWFVLAHAHLEGRSVRVPLDEDLDEEGGAV